MLLLYTSIDILDYSVSRGNSALIHGSSILCVLFFSGVGGGGGGGGYKKRAPCRVFRHHCTNKTQTIQRGECSKHHGLWCKECEVLISMVRHRPNTCHFNLVFSSCN